MSGHLDRLRRGERWWAAEFILRLGGLLLLGGAQRTALLAHRLISAPPVHPATPSEFVICGAAFLLLTSGLALTLEGPGLLRHVPVPPHSAYYPRN